MVLYYIYCIWVKTNDRVLRYYGHTENMRVRKNKHVGRHKEWVKAGKPERLRDVHGTTRSVYVLEHEDWRMDVVDKIECETKDEARTLEGEWILKYDCVNMYVAGRTRQEYRKQYHQEHKNEIIEKVQKWYQEHKEEVSAKRAEKVTCKVCGSQVSKRNIAPHHKSKKCQNALNSSDSNINTNE
jgi:hypothetical protein